MLSTPVLLKVEAIAKHFGGVVAIADMSFDIAAGSLHVILGPNGCGKTTLFNVIDGTYKPTKGAVYFNEQRIDSMAPHLIARAGIARKYQIPGVFGDLTVAKNLEVSLARREDSYGMAALLKIKPDKNRRDELAELAGLENKLDYKVSDISHGERQKLEIAMLLLDNVKLLLLDEPTAGMSVTETAAIAHLIHKLRDELGLAVLVVEHDLGFVRELDAPVLVGDQGRLIAQGTYDEVRKDPRVIQSYLGAANA